MLSTCEKENDGWGCLGKVSVSRVFSTAPHTEGSHDVLQQCIGGQVGHGTYSPWCLAPLRYLTPGYLPFLGTYPPQVDTSVTSITGWGGALGAGQPESLGVPHGDTEVRGESAGETDP